MPRLVEGSERSGALRAEIAARFGFAPGVVVAGGAGDNAAAAVGMGVVDTGQAFLSLGTSGVLFAPSPGYAAAPETSVHSFCHALPGRWHQMGVILAASDALVPSSAHAPRAKAASGAEPPGSKWRTSGCIVAACTSAAVVGAWPFFASPPSSKLPSKISSIASAFSLTWKKPTIRPGAMASSIKSIDLT